MSTGLNNMMPKMPFACAVSTNFPTSEVRLVAAIEEVVLIKKPNQLWTRLWGSASVSSYLRSALFNCLWVWRPGGWKQDVSGSHSTMFIQCPRPWSYNLLHVEDLTYLHFTRLWRGTAHNPRGRNGRLGLQAARPQWSDFLRGILEEIFVLDWLRSYWVHYLTSACYYIVSFIWILLWKHLKPCVKAHLQWINL